MGGLPWEGSHGRPFPREASHGRSCPLGRPPWEASPGRSPMEDLPWRGLPCEASHGRSPRRSLPGEPSELKPPMDRTGGTGRNRTGHGQDGAGRDGTKQDETGRDGTGRNAKERDGAGTKQDRANHNGTWQEAKSPKRGPVNVKTWTKTSCSCLWGKRPMLQAIFWLNRLLTPASRKPCFFAG